MVRQYSYAPAVFALAAVLFAAFLLIPADAAAAAGKQGVFASPDAAIEALVKAAGENNTQELLRLFGPGSRSLVSSGDPVEDRQHREQFVKSYQEKHYLETGTDGKITLFVGNNDWPMSIPIVKAGSRWRFDTEAGKKEILCRRIGRNELGAIQVILAIADAQREYSDRMRQKTGQPEYAQKFVSEPGKEDGLYWVTSPDGKPSPLGVLAARASAEGYHNSVGGKEPYHGYLYRLLKSQGKHAEGGAFSYVVNGKMIGGYALIAYPAAYRSSGVRTFIVNYDGVVYGKDLGKKTASRAASMSSFDPDDTWKKVQ
ncbi:MAG TPA: DUF2950 domain-containing protein [Syntrophales bacterium]|nr:DUF2950 domain-containing protein [Syntrophales bacterium]